MKDKTFVVSVVTPFWVERCVETLYRYTDDFYLILVDHGKGYEIPKSIMNQVHLYIHAYRNLGYSKSMNTGIRLADTEWVCALNDDVEFINKKWWQGIMDTFDKFKTAACVNPSSIRSRSGESLIEYKETYLEDDYQLLLDNHHGVIDGICTWCTVFPKWALERIGLFEERLPGTGQDYDWNARAYQAGYRCLGTRLSWVWHWWGGSMYHKPESFPIEPVQIENPVSLHKQLWSGRFSVFGRECKRTQEKPGRVPL